LQSATRREELLLTDQALAASHLLRRELSNSPADAMQQLLVMMKRFADEVMAATSTPAAPA